MIKRPKLNAFLSFTLYSGLVLLLAACTLAKTSPPPATPTVAKTPIPITKVVGTPTAAMSNPGSNCGDSPIDTFQSAPFSIQGESHTVLVSITKCVTNDVGFFCQDVRSGQSTFGTLAKPEGEVVTTCTPPDAPYGLHVLFTAKKIVSVSAVTDGEAPILLSRK